MNPASTLSPNTQLDCRQCQAALPDLLLDPESAVALAARPHLLTCDSCRLELAALEATSGLLDRWPAPEPSDWFDQRLRVRFREAQTEVPEGFFERLRSRLLFSTGRELRPLLAGGLALLLAIGGGTAALTLHTPPAAVQASATVQDLQILDRNDQAIQTMDQLLDDNAPDDSGSAQGTS